MNTEKQRIYSQMADYLLGDKKAIFSFDSVEYKELFFFLFKRRIFKDEIAKGNTTLDVETAGSPLTLTDTGAASSYVIGDAGDEAPVFSGSTQVGKVYYNAGIIALATGAFVPAGSATQLYWSGSSDIDAVSISGNIDNIVHGCRNRLNEITFNNQTNLHSTYYFCRAFNNEFNYSSNPTFIDSDGRIVPTSGTDNQTRTYITTVGLYDVNNNLLGVAKLSEPVKKSPDNELVLRIRLAY